MKSKQLFDTHKFLCMTALTLMEKKNHDYAGKSGNEPFANFTRAETMGICSTEKGILIRMLDKMSRLSSFLDSREFKVQDEKLEDTIIDMINYSVLLYAYIHDKNCNELKSDKDIKYNLYAQYGYEEDPYGMYSKGPIIPNNNNENQ